MDLDIKLLGKAIRCHGMDLVDKIKEEQQTEPSSSLLSFIDRRRPLDEEKNERFLEDVRSFIARKSDMLFKPLVHEDDESKDKEQETEDIPDVFAIMPPLETFMDVPASLRRDNFYNSLSRDDCVTGVVQSILDSGLLVRILCVNIGPPRDLDDLDIMAFCPAKELPRLYAKESALDAFQENDIIRGIVLNINAETERIILSLHEKSIPNEQTYPRIGLITEDEFPVHYRRKSEVKNKAYEDLLESVMGFNNVGNIKTLVEEQGFSEVQSYTRSLARLNIPQMEYAEGLNKWQSQKMAHQSVASGVGMFKEGKYMEAMQHFNKALQIDAENVEGLVARGALFANKENFEKAVADFKKALSINPTHGNARNYLIETLLTMGKLLEDRHQLEEACEHYKQALEIDPDHTEAKDILEVCQKLLAFQMKTDKGVKSPEKMDDKVATGSSDSDSDTGLTCRKKKKSHKSSPSILSKSTEKLLQLIKEDETKMGRSKKKRKHKRSSDHSSSDREDSKRKRKRRKSRTENGSSSDSDSPDRHRGKGKGKQVQSSSPPKWVTGRDACSSDFWTGGKDLTHEASDFVPTSFRTSATSFLPLSSERFFSKSTTIPGLGSPPSSPPAKQKQETESAGEKDLKDRRLPSPDANPHGDQRSRYERRDSYLMEQRKKFYEEERQKSESSTSSKRKQQSKLTNYPSSSSSSSSSSSDDEQVRRRGGQGRSKNRSSQQKSKRRGSSRSRTRSRSHSRSREDAGKPKDTALKRTGIAELDMYLGDRSSGSAILALLGHGSKSPKRSPLDNPKTHSRSRSRSRGRKYRKSRSKSPLGRRRDWPRSRSFGRSKQRRSRSRSPSSLRKRSKSRTEEVHESDKLKARRDLNKDKGCTSFDGSGKRRDPDDSWNTDEWYQPGKTDTSKWKAIPDFNDRENRLATKELVGRKEDVREFPQCDFESPEKRNKRKTDGSLNLEKIEVATDSKPNSRPSLPLVIRKPVMDDPKFYREMISSKDYDAMERERRLKKVQEESLENEKIQSMDDAEPRRKRNGADDTQASLLSSSSSSSKEVLQNKKDRDWLRRRDEKYYEGQEDSTPSRKDKNKSHSDTDEEMDGRSKNRKDKHIVLAPEDLEKEIERRVKERLMEEELKEKRKKEAQRMDHKRSRKDEEIAKEDYEYEKKEQNRQREEVKRKRKDESSAIIQHKQSGWTEDGAKVKYFAKRQILPSGYYIDKFGKSYYMGHHPKTGKLGRTQEVVSKNEPSQTYPGINAHAKNILLSSISDAERDKSMQERMSKPSSRWDSQQRKDSRERHYGHSPSPEHSKFVRGRSVKEGRESKRERIDSDHDSDDDSHSTGSKSTSVTNTETLSHSIYKDRSSDSWKDRGQKGVMIGYRYDKAEDSASTSKKSLREHSRWDAEDSPNESEKQSERRDAKGKLMSVESLTDLEKFLTSLKQTKKQQWIAEGKIKEKH